MMWWIIFVALLALGVWIILIAYIFDSLVYDD